MSRSKLTLMALTAFLAVYSDLSAQQNSGSTQPPQESIFGPSPQDLTNALNSLPNIFKQNTAAVAYVSKQLVNPLNAGIPPVILPTTDDIMRGNLSSTEQTAISNLYSAVQTYSTMSQSDQQQVTKLASSIAQGDPLPTGTSLKMLQFASAVNPKVYSQQYFNTLQKIYNSMEKDVAPLDVNAPSSSNLKPIDATNSGGTGL